MFNPECVMFSSHLVGGLRGVVLFLWGAVLSVWLIARRGLLVAGGNRSVVLRGAGGDVPEIDL